MDRSFNTHAAGRQPGGCSGTSATGPRWAGSAAGTGGCAGRGQQARAACAASAPFTPAGAAQRKRHSLGARHRLSDGDEEVISLQGRCKEALHGQAHRAESLLPAASVHCRGCMRPVSSNMQCSRCPSQPRQQRAEQGGLPFSTPLLFFLSKTSKPKSSSSPPVCTRG